MTSFIGQSGAIKERIGKSGAWIRNVGRDSAYSDPDFTRRCHSIAADGWYHEDGLNDLSNQYVLQQAYKPDPSSATSIAVRNSVANIGEVITVFDNGLTNRTLTVRSTAFALISVADCPSNNIAAPLVPYLYLVSTDATNTATSCNFGVTNVQVGNFMSIKGDADWADTDGKINLGGANLIAITHVFQVVEIRSISQIVVELISPEVIGTIAGVSALLFTKGPLATVHPLARTVPDLRNGKNSVFFNFQPSLGIFDLHQGIGSGDFKFQFTPNVNYEYACVESAGFNVRTGNTTATVGNVELKPLMPYSDSNKTGYKLNITNVLLYIATIKQSMPMSGVLPLSLMETQIMQKTLTSVTAGTTNQLDFTVPPSTLAISIWVQGSQTGNTTLLPPTKFKVAQGTNTPDENLQSVQITYGNTTKPSTLFQSSYNKPLPSSAISSQMQQRWIMSQQNAGKFGNEGGTESYRDYLNSGAYYHFDFSRDKQDSSSYVNVLISFNENLPAGSNLYICAWYSRQVEIAFESGVVTSVVSVNR
jgi:hypothetical protein